MSQDSGGDRSTNVTDGNLVWPLIVLSVPLMVSYVLQVGYNLTDTYWIGRLGQEAVSALSYAWAIENLVISSVIGFTFAGTVLVAQNKGAGAIDRVANISGQTITLVITLAMFLSVVGYVCVPILLQTIGADPGSLEYTYALQYLRIQFIGLPFIFMLFLFQGLLQGWGDTRTPLYLMAASVVINVLIDPFFILGFEGNTLFTWLNLEPLESRIYAATGFDGFGVQGAAVATLLARGAAAIIGLGLLLSGRVGIQLSLSDFTLERRVVQKIFSIGAPTSIEVTATSASVTVLTAVVALSGAEAVAAYGIGSRITSVITLLAFGLAGGVETVVGQNLGAGQVDRAKRGVYTASGLIMSAYLVFSLGVYSFAEPIVDVFITGSGAPVVIGIGTEYLQIICLSYVFLGLFEIVQAGIRGSGSTRAAMYLSIVGYILFRAVFAYTLAEPFGLGATGVWYGEMIANVCMAVVVCLYFLRGTWIDGVVDQPDDSSGDESVETETSVTNGGVDYR